MKTIRKFVLPLMTFILTNCSNSNSNWHECKTIEIRVSNDKESVSRTYNYNRTTSYVFEYKSDSGDTLYANYRKYIYEPESDNSIRVYENENSEPIVYNCTRLVGLLDQEKTYYLNLEERKIDCVTKWFELKEYEKSTELNNEPIDNAEAFKCAQNSYYLLDQYAFGYKHFPIYKYKDLKSLERHSYIVYSEGNIVTYEEA